MKEQEEKKLQDKDAKEEAQDSGCLSETWAADAQDDLEDWIEEQGIQLRY